jgi:hypothetical protein
MKQWICGANPQLKFTKKGMAYNLNAQSYLATQTSVFLASIYGEQLPRMGLLLWQCVSLKSPSLLSTHWHNHVRRGLRLAAGNVVHRTEKKSSKRYLCWARAQMRCDTQHSVP